MPYEVVEVPMGTAYSWRGNANSWKALVIRFDGDMEGALEELNSDPALYEGISNYWDGQEVYLYKKGLNMTPDLAKPEDGCTWHYVKFDTGLAAAFLYPFLYTACALTCTHARASRGPFLLSCCTCCHVAGK